MRTQDCDTFAVVGAKIRKRSLGIPSTTGKLRQLKSDALLILDSGRCEAGVIKYLRDFGASVLFLALNNFSQAG